MPDEKELMFQVKGGQLDKLAVLYENNKLALLNFFKRSGNSHALSEDLVQETFMRVLAYRTSFLGKSTFKSWLYGIARNTLSDHFRKTGNRPIYDDIDGLEISDETSLDDKMLSEQQTKLFKKSLANLSFEHRELILLSRFQQLNYQEIASLLDCNLNTLKARMRSAIAKLHLGYQQLVSEVG